MIIYKITNKINGKVYIGQTTQTLKKRWSQHKDSRYCRVLARAIQKYGSENFQIEVLEECSSLEELNQREEQLIKSFNSLVPNGYNLESGGNNFQKHPESNKKLSDSLKKYYENNNVWNKGRKLSEETKRNMSLAKLGKKQSEAHKKAISESHKGKTLEEITKQKIGNAHRGKVLSAETRKKLSEAHKGKVYSESLRKKMKDVQEKKPVIAYNYTNQKGWFFCSTSEARKFGFDSGAISRCCQGKRKAHKGFQWRYYEE